MRMLTIAALVVVLTIVSTVAFAAIIWDGTGVPDPASITTPSAWTWDYNGLGYTRMYNEGGEAYIRFNGTLELIRANGWFIETRVKVAAPTSLNWNAGMVVGDNVGGGAFLLFSTTQLQGYQNDGGATPFTVAWNENDWNVLRMTMPVGGTVDTPLQISLNGSNVGSITMKGYHSFSAQVINLADMTSGLSDVAWDYVHVNYEAPPVPEPASMMALAMGMLGLGGVSLRRRK